MLFPAPGGSVVMEGGANTSALHNSGQLTAGGSAHTKGSYVQFFAALPYEGVCIDFVCNVASAGSAYLVDIAIGAASSEVVIAPNLMIQMGIGAMPSGGVCFYRLPIRVPAGARVAARCQATDASDTLNTQMRVIASGAGVPQPFNRMTAYGISTSVSNGVLCDPGGTVNTKVRTQIVASCANPLRAILPAWGNNNNAATDFAHFAFDVEAGAGDEIVIPDIWLFSNSSEELLPHAGAAYPCDIPAGTELSANVQSSESDATDRLVRIAYYGFD